MFIAHIAAGSISGIVVGAMIHSWGYPLWLSILGYSLSGTCITLLSALVWFLLFELSGRHPAARIRPEGGGGLTSGRVN